MTHFRQFIYVLRGKIQLYIEGLQRPKLFCQTLSEKSDSIRVTELSWPWFRDCPRQSHIITMTLNKLLPLFIILTNNFIIIIMPVTWKIKDDARSLSVSSLAYIKSLVSHYWASYFKFLEPLFFHLQSGGNYHLS